MRSVEGEVSAFDEAIVTFTIYDSEGMGRRISAVVDTGFTEVLTLPAALVAELSLARTDSTRLTLADGSKQWFRGYEATVEWGEEERTIRIHEAEGGALVGMGMLRGYHLGMDVVDGGRVVITPLS